MKNILVIIKGILRGFIFNPFWKSAAVLVCLVLSLATGSVLWYIYTSKLHENPIPFIFASVLIILNFVLANFLWNREKLASYFLIYTALFVQILMLLFIRYLFLTF